ncbi:hypothetical protein THAOC_10738, partial [Thalassiosira oceanica]
EDDDTTNKLEHNPPPGNGYSGRSTGKVITCARRLTPLETVETSAEKKKTTATAGWGPTMASASVGSPESDAFAAFTVDGGSPLSTAGGICELRLVLADKFDNIDRERTGTLSVLPPAPQDASQLPPSGRRKWRRNKFQQRRSNNKNKHANKNDAETKTLAKEQAPPLQLKNKKPVVVSISAPDLVAPMEILPRVANDASGGQPPKKNGGQKKHNRHKGGRGGQRGRGKAVHHRTRDASVPTHIGGGGQGGQYAYAYPPVENLELPSIQFDPYHSAYGQHQAPLDSVSSGSTSDEAQTASYSSHGHGQYGHGWYVPYYGVPHHMHGQYGAFYNNGTVYYPHPMPHPYGFPCYDYSHYSYYQHQGADGTDSMGVHDADPLNPQGEK